jgi:hypothetical protein
MMALFITIRLAFIFLSMWMAIIYLLVAMLCTHLLSFKSFILRIVQSILNICSFKERLLSSTARMQWPFLRKINFRKKIPSFILAKRTQVLKNNSPFMSTAGVPVNSGNFVRFLTMIGFFLYKSFWYGRPFFFAVYVQNRGLSSGSH